MADQKGKMIDLTKRVEVIHTEKNPHRKAGETSKVHPEVADKLKKKGWIK
jgi:hypothetical protein